MMRTALVIALLFLLPIVHAEVSQLTINANVRTDAVTQTATYQFSPLLGAGQVDYTLPHAATGISVTGDGKPLGYTATGNNISIILTAPVSNLTITYSAGGIVYRSDSVYHFFTEFDFDSLIKQFNITVTLPAGYTIHDNFYRPAYGVVDSDGTSIIIRWSENYASGKYFFSVNFFNPNEKAEPFVFVTVVLAAGIFIGAAHFRRKLRESFMKGFREDEKKTIEYLRLNKTSLQSDLQKQFGFSRAKSTRIIMNLEQKGLVRKQKYGRTNKLHWLK